MDTRAPPRIRAPAGALGDRANDDEEDDDDEDDRHRVDVYLPLFRAGADLLCSPPRLFRRQLQLGDDSIGAGDDAAAHVAGFEFGQDRLADNEAGNGIGQHIVGAIAGGDPHLMLIRCDHHDDAIITLLVADLPGAPKPIGIIFDRIALKAFDRGDHELPPALRLESGKLARQIEFLLRAQQVGLIDDPSRQRRKVLRGRGQREQGQPEGGNDAKHAHAAFLYCGRLGLLLSNLSTSLTPVSMASTGRSASNLETMSLAMAVARSSVSKPSRPLPTAIRTLPSSAAISMRTALATSARPIPQRLPSSNATSSMDAPLRLSRVTTTI